MNVDSLQIKKLVLKKKKNEKGVVGWEGKGNIHLL